MTGLEHETDEGGAHDASLSANNFNCAICFELLLDPVVGSCGHDFCMHCITAWKEERQRANKSIQCPVCRSELISPYQPFGVCIRIRETIEKLFPEQLAARRRDVEQARLAAAAHAAALNASSQFGGTGYATADAELQASFSTYADAYRQLSQNLLSLIARQQEAAVGQQQFHAQHAQLAALQQMHSASLRANLQGSLQQLLLRPPAHPASSTTSSSSTATALSHQHTAAAAAAAAAAAVAASNGATDMQVDAAPPAAEGAAAAAPSSDPSVDAALPQQHVHMQPSPVAAAAAAPAVLDQHSAGVAAFVLQLAQLQQQQAQQQGLGSLPDSQTAALYQQQQEVMLHWYASLIAHQQQAAAAAAAAAAGAGGAAATPAAAGAAAAVAAAPTMPRAVMNSWMVPSALTSEADLMRLYASLQSRIQTCERLLCMSGHADMVAARQAADAQHAGSLAAAAAAAAAAASAPTPAAAGSSGMPPYLLYMQQLQAQQQAAAAAAAFSSGSGQAWQQQQQQAAVAAAAVAAQAALQQQQQQQAQPMDISGSAGAAVAASGFPSSSLGFPAGAFTPSSPRYTSSQQLLQERLLMQRQMQQQQASQQQQQQLWWQQRQQAAAQVQQQQQQAAAAAAAPEGQQH